MFLGRNLVTSAQEPRHRAIKLQKICSDPPLGTCSLFGHFIYLKGHGNEMRRIFLGFLQKSVPHESLTLPFEPVRIQLRIRGVGELTTPRFGELGSCFSVTNIFANSKRKSEQLEMQCKGLMRNRFLQKPREIRLIAMSL